MVNNKMEIRNKEDAAPETRPNRDKWGNESLHGRGVRLDERYLLLFKFFRFAVAYQFMLEA